VFRRVRFLRGVQLKGSGAPDVWWFRADGRKMTRRDWQDGELLLGMFLNGREIPTPGPHGEEIDDDSFLVLFNASAEARAMTLPRRRFGAQWALELSTADPSAEPGGARYSAQDEVPLPSRSVTVLKRVR
jgi:glycogen operon protein